MAVRTKEVFCPRCNMDRGQDVPPVRHLAGAEGNDTLWFTCGTMKYELPDAWDPLGTAAWTRVAPMLRDERTGCMACGREVGGTIPDDGGTVWWVCYRCGTVGCYTLTIRDNYDPADDIAHILPTPEPEPEREPDLFADRAADIEREAAAIWAAMEDGTEPVADAVARALAEHRVMVTFDPDEPRRAVADAPPPIPLTIPPGSPFGDVRRTGSSVHADTLARPEDIPGTGVGARLRRTELRFTRFMSGLD